MGVGGGEVGVGDASLGAGGQQVATQDLWPGAGAPVEDSSPAPSPALTLALLIYLQCSQSHFFSMCEDAWGGEGGEGGGRVVPAPYLALPWALLVPLQ